MPTFKGRYNRKSLVVSAYGGISYLPKVNLLDQLGTDLDELHAALVSKDENAMALRQQEVENRNKAENEKSTSVKAIDPLNLGDPSLTLKVKVPPDPTRSMRNDRTGKTFPIGTATDPETGEQLKKVEFEVRKRPLKNQLIYSDPQSSEGVFYYADEKGHLATGSLGATTTVESNPSLIVSLLSHKISVGGFTTSYGKAINWPKEEIEALYLKFYAKDDNHEADIQEKRKAIMAKYPIDPDTPGVPLFMYNFDKKFLEYVNSRLVEIESQIESGELPVYVPSNKGASQLGEEYAQLVATALFAQEYSQLLKDTKEEERKALSTSPEDAPIVSNIKEDTRFLPHQAYALSFMKDRKAAMVDADPGAGKTLMILADILDKLNRGKVSRPLVIMPNSLLGQQKLEFEQWTKGTVNILAINTQSVKRADPEATPLKSGPNAGRIRDGSHDRGLQALADQIKSTPKNTILMTSYEWLARHKVVRASMDSFPRVNWLLSLGVDMVSLDECHKVRINSSGGASDAAEAIMQMSAVPYKRAFSGTVAPASPDDVFLPVSFLDRSVLGTREQFISRYAMSTDPWSNSSTYKKVEAWKPGAIKELRDHVSKRVGVSIRRSAWLDKLPDLRVNIHDAPMTILQHKVYDRIVDRILAEEIGNSDMKIGLDLQKEMAAKNASNPQALSQIRAYQGGQRSITIENEDGELERLTINDNSSESEKELFDMGKRRLQEGLQRYTEAMVDADDMPGIEDERELLTKFQAIDKYLNDPASDEFGHYFLTDEYDRISPKVKVVDKLLADHFSNPNNGKVIIFTHYKNVAAHFAQNIKMKDRAVVYDAGRQKALQSFKDDPNVQIIIAVEQSIQEGHNLQMANRIIRLDLPWNPGNYQQSIARAYRLPPRDKSKASYPVVYVDIILCNATAEVTKFARMVSKMHATKQLVSGFTPGEGEEFPLVGMSIENMRRTFCTLEQASQHIEAFHRMREYEKEEAKLAPEIYGTDLHELATGEQMDGEVGKIETPPLDDDRLRDPWNVDSSDYRAGTIQPTFLQWNGVYYLAVPRQSGMQRLLMYFSTPRSPLGAFRRVDTLKDAIDIVRTIQRDGNTSVVNAQQVFAILSGQAPVDARFPSLTVNIPSGASRTAKLKRASTADIAAINNPSTVKDILAYTPSQEDMVAAKRAMAQIHQSFFSAKKLTDIHVLFAAKAIGLLGIDPLEGAASSPTTPQSFWRNTHRAIVMTPGAKKTLKAQLGGGAAEPAQQPAKQQAPAAPTAPAVTQQVEEPAEISDDALGGPQDDELAGLNLRVCLMGKMQDGAPKPRPYLYVDPTSPYAEPLTKFGFHTSDEELGIEEGDSLWVHCGYTLAECKSVLTTFSRRLYEWGWSLKDREDYFSMLATAGLSRADIEKIWSVDMETGKKTAEAALLEDFPEYTDLIQSIFA